MKFHPVLAALSISAIAFLSGCSTPGVNNQQAGFTPSGWRTVAVLPFGGDARFAEEAGRSFGIHGLNVPGFQIVQVSTASILAPAIGITPAASGFTVAEAQKVGKAVGAEAVIIGTVTSYNNGFTLNGYCTAQIIDVASGEIVGASNNPSGLLVGLSEHHCVMAAAKRTGKATREMLLELSRKNRPAFAGR